MGDLPDSQRLTELAIPGSHDSTATIDYKFRELVITEHGEDPDLTIDEQLRVGTRFLDIRLLQEQNSRDVPRHREAGSPVFEVLESAYGFLEEFPSEVLVDHGEGSAIGPIKCRSLSRLTIENPGVGTSPTQLVARRHAVKSSL